MENININELLNRDEEAIKIKEFLLNFLSISVSRLEKGRIIMFLIRKKKAFD